MELLIYILMLLPFFILLGVSTRAETGYGGSSVSITTGGTYNGGGTSGYVGGSAYTFSPTQRSWRKIRELVKTTNDQYHQAISGALKLQIDLDGFSTADGNPPAAMINSEAALLSIATGSRTVACVVLLEVYEVRAGTSLGCAIKISGPSDGAFSIT